MSMGVNSYYAMHLTHEKYERNKVTYLVISRLLIGAIYFKSLTVGICRFLIIRVHI